MIVKEDIEEEDAKKKKEKELDFDLTKFFKDNGIPDAINKLQKQDLFEPLLFFKIDIATLETTLDIKPEGKKHKIMKKIKEIRAKFEKDEDVSYLDMGLLEQGEEPVLNFKFAKSQTSNFKGGNKS